MASNGTIIGVTKRSDGTITDNYSFRAQWIRNSFSAANNTSNITVQLIVRNEKLTQGAYNTTQRPGVSLTVGGIARSATVGYIDTRSKGKDCEFATWTGDVKHNEDGTLSCAIAASFNHYGSNSLGSGELSGTAELDELKPMVRMTLAAVNGDLPDDFNGLYIQGKSKVKAEITAASPNGADIVSHSLRVEDVTYEAGGGQAESGFLAKYGETTVRGYATDSEGVTGYAEQRINVIPYSKPQVQATAFRSKNGKPDETGTGLTVEIKVAYSKVEVNGTPENDCVVRYKLDTDEEWTDVAKHFPPEENQFTFNANRGLSPTKTYMVYVEVVDYIGEVARTTVRLLGKDDTDVYMHRTKNAMGLGGLVEEERLLDVYWNAKFRGDVQIGDKTLREYILDIINGG